MDLQRTFAIIKPNAVRNGHIGEIISAIEREGFTIHGLRMAQLSKELVRGFYIDHLGKAFYPNLEAFMLEGPVVLMALEGENVIARWRELMGATDPAKASAGTLRRAFGEDVTRNAVHGSDAPETAQREVMYFFSAFDLV
ncbi:MAG: Nucleoside diphosphate kinase [Acidobacteria bacterium ADurb.Bin340]|jgi:nucleoside-diphosphate kinase|nr:MAG: Nucleoside diphosphate kinase [Acidobacteria bacterium ADurb.Bin340]HOD33011.1 nucleoside-diphosphate kinase [Holophaga sp.]HQL49414.1 nucleoside-diphosphate kinase [Holophaga sp.]